MTTKQHADFHSYLWLLRVLETVPKYNPNLTSKSKTVYIIRHQINTFKILSELRIKRPKDIYQHCCQTYLQYSRINTYMNKTLPVL